MTSRNEASSSSQTSMAYRLLERVTAAVLLLVLATLAWMIVAAYFPDWGRLASLEIEVILIIGLLLATLLLVSIVALLHTRK
jgi:hypothetical protein